MASFLHPLRPKSLAFLTIILLLILTACASNNGVSTGSNKNIDNNKSGVSNSSNVKNNKSDVSSKSNTSNTSNNTKNSASISKSPLIITVGGKPDAASQLLIKMYTLLLRHAGFNIVERANVGTDNAALNAMVSGQIDLSPEFTAVGLKKLGLNSIGNAQLDYLQIKQGYEAKYHVTWLDPAPLNAEVYNSAPMVRDSILKKAPQIAVTLNRLAPILTTQVSLQLQSEVVSGKSVNAVATQFLQSKGLL
jgi:glycine betaine/choline ABC-type transport system substrate-binding protein